MRRMERIPVVGMMIVVGASMAGCDALFGVLTPNRTGVVLDNRGDYPVDVVLYYGDAQETPKDAVRLFGHKREFHLEAGGKGSFSLPCDELQVVFIDEADLRIVGSIGPESDTSVLRDGSDFNCGNTITFTFDHPRPVPTDLSITVGVR